MIASLAGRFPSFPPHSWSGKKAILLNFFYFFFVFLRNICYT
jgi:hypothetical protein